MRRGLLGIAGVAAALIVPASATATFPGENGRILFISDNVGEMQTGLLGARSASTILPEYASGEYSKDGTRIVVDLEKPVAGCPVNDECAGEHEIYTLDPDGGNVDRLTHSAAFESQPTWHPSGNRIAYTRGDRIIEQVLSTGERTELGPSASEAPAYSPAGAQIAFGHATAANGLGVFVMDADGSDVRNLTPGVTVEEVDPSWSPDGATIAYGGYGTGGDRVYTIPSDSTGGAGVVNLAAGERPVFSPDGELILFTGGLASELRTMTTAGADVTPVSFSPDSSVATSWQAVSAAEYEDADADETVTTGAEATPDEPVQASVTTPNAGVVSIALAPGADSPGSGFASLGFNFDIVAPSASVANPLQLTFLIDASMIPSGETAGTIAIFRNGVEVLDCEGVANPDPCVSERTTGLDGDATIKVLTSQASVWDFGVVDDVAPRTTITTKPGRTTTQRRVRIAFRSNEAGSTFRCSWDGAPARPCDSPVRSKRLGFGKHVFAVTATDQAGNKDLTPAKARFKVVRR